MDQNVPLTKTPDDEFAEQRARNLFAELETNENIIYVETPGTKPVIQIHNVDLKRVTIPDPIKPDKKIIVFCPMDKLWATFRKRIFDLYTLSISGSFNHDPDEGTITCRFFPDTALLEKKGIVIPPKTYQGMFEDLYPEWSSFFKTHFEEWLEAENGYFAYQKMRESGVADPEKYRIIFNRYLRSVKLRTRADDAESAKRRRQAEENLRQLMAREEELRKFFSKATS